VANNVVLREVTSEYVLLLNPDAELDEGTLDHLLGVMGEQQDIGIAGCRLLTADGSLDHAAKRSIPDPWTAARYFA
jgi:GT2 family glycosyltransferase